MLTASLWPSEPAVLIGYIVLTKLVQTIDRHKYLIINADYIESFAASGICLWSQVAEIGLHNFCVATIQLYARQVTSISESDPNSVLLPMHRSQGLRGVTKG